MAGAESSFQLEKTQVDGESRLGIITDEADRIRKWDTEVRELRSANTILKSASTCPSR